MRNGLTSSAVAAILVSALATGCSGSPVSPGVLGRPGDAQAPGADSTAVSAHKCLGLYRLVFDTEKWDVEAIPARVGEWHVNVTGALNSTMGLGLAGVPGEHDPANGLFVFDVTVTHPFGTKPQLAGFDVKGILITPGLLAIGSLVFADVDETRLENADGYSRWWNPTEFTLPGMFGYTKGVFANAEESALTATVNPYKYFGDILCAECPMNLVYDEPMDSDAGRGVFTAGSGNTRRYRMRFPMDPGPQIVLGYAIDASWVAPSPNPPEEIPDDFPIEANQPEAFYVHAHPTVSTLYYDNETGRGGGVLRFQVNAHDWQGQVGADIADQISGVRVFCPELFSGGVDGAFLNETSVKARYTADLTGTVAPTHSGQVLAAVRVGSEGGPSYDQGVGPAPSSDVSAWDALVLDILEPECTADWNNDWMDAVAIEVGDYVTGQVCSPTDYRDYYIFEIPFGHVLTGELRLWCDADPSELDLYNASLDLIAEAPTSGGLASIDLEALGVMPGEYYVRVYTSDDGFAVPYLLEFTGELVDLTPSNPVNITPDGLYVDPTVVFWKGDCIYLAGIAGFWAYDASELTNPQRIFQERIFVSRAAMSGDYIYAIEYFLGMELGLTAIDVSNPEAPVIHSGLVSLDEEVWAIAMNSTHVYLSSGSVGSANNVQIYDWATDPLNPSLVGEFAASPGNIDVLALVDPEGPDTVLLTGYHNRIEAYDVEDPSSVSQCGSHSCICLEDIAVHDGYVCCSGDVMGVDGGLFVLAFTKPIGFGALGSCDTPGSAWHIQVEWPLAYIGDGEGGLAICEMNNPSSPTVVSSTPLVAKGDDLAVNGDYLCIIPEGAGFEVFNVDAPSAPASLYLTNVVNWPYFGCPVGDYLVVNDAGASYWAIKTIDISDPASAHVVAQMPFGAFRPTLLLIDDNGTALAAGDQNWALLDASDPLSISILTVESVGSPVDGCAIKGEAVYIGNQSQIDIWDIDPLPATWKAKKILSGGPYWIEVQDDYMYVSEGDVVTVFSISDPLSPAKVCTYIPGATPKQTEALGDYLYVTTGGHLEVVDISNPTIPSHLGSVHVVSPPGTAVFVGVHGQFAYVSGNMDTLICGVWPPDDPTVLGPLEEMVVRIGIGKVFRDDILFDMGYPAGMQIYDLY